MKIAKSGGKLKREEEEVVSGETTPQSAIRKNKGPDASAGFIASWKYPSIRTGHQHLSGGTRHVIGHKGLITKKQRITTRNLILGQKVWMYKG